MRNTIRTNFTSFKFESYCSQAFRNRGVAEAFKFGDGPPASQGTKKLDFFPEGGFCVQIQTLLVSKFCPDSPAVMFSVILREGLV